jgi:Fe-S cluster assembly iron-binding protein IscA
MSLKFKYFFDSGKGVPSENELNKFLEENNINEIKHSVMSGGCLGIFYKEDLDAKYLKEVKKRYK